MNEVVPRLFVGSKPQPGTYVPGIDVIVLAALEYQPPDSLFPGTEIIHAPLDDDSRRALREDEIATALQAAECVAQRLRQGLRVLVTCAMGLNRSALIAALAIRQVYGVHPEEIIRRIRQARGPLALSNPNFERLLRAVAEPA